MTYHFLVTLSWNPDPRSTRTRYVTGQIPVNSTTTREELTVKAISAAKEAMGANDTAVVLFLSLEPNELPS